MCVGLSVASEAKHDLEELVDPARRTNLLDGLYFDIAGVPLEVSATDRNGGGLARANDAMLTIDANMHLTGEDRHHLLALRMKMFAGDRTVGSDRVLDLE